MSDQTQPNPSHISGISTLLQTIPAWEFSLLDQRKSKYTIKAFIGDLSLFAGFFPSEKTLREVSTADINNFLNWLQEKRGVPCSPKSYARRITSIKSFFRWLAKNGRISLDPAEMVVQRTVLSPLPEILSPDEQEKILQVTREFQHLPKPELRHFVLYRLLITTGIKKNECLAIHLNHIELEAANGPYLFVRYSQASNRFKERKINLPEDWVQVYRKYLEQYQPKDLVFPWSPRRLEYLLEDLSREADIHKHLSFDMCRWTCALNDWNANVETDSIRQKMGISKVQWREISMKLKQLSSQSESTIQQLFQ